MSHDVPDALRIARALAEARVAGTRPSAALLSEIDALFSSHQHLVLALCRRMVGDPERADELAQDALLRAFQKFPDFRGEARFSTWLLGVARYECLNARRRQADLLTIDGVIEAEGPHHSVLSALRRQERETLLREATATLEPLEQEAVWLRYVEQIPVEEIERLLPIPGSTGARGLLQRCRRKLERTLRARLDELGQGSSLLRPSGDE